MPGPAQTINIDWTGVRTDRPDRKIEVGEVRSLVNYRWTPDGLEKRLGWQRSIIDTFHGGAYQGPAVELVQDDSSTIWRDSENQIWAKDAVSGEAYFRGESLRCAPSWHEIADELYFTHKPLAVMRGSDLWTFTLGFLDAAGANPAYQLTIIDPVTKTVKRETFTVAVPGAVAYAVTVDASDNVWLLYVTGGTTIALHKYDTPESSATVGTFVTQAGAAFVGIDAKSIPTADYVAVVALSSDGSTTSGVYRAYAAIAGMTATGSYYTTSGGSGFTTGISMLEWADAAAGDGYVHFAYYEAGVLKLEKYPELAPASTVITTLATMGATSTDYGVAGIGGHVETNGDRVVNATLAGVFGSDDSFDSKDRLIVTRYTYNGTTVTPLVTARSAYVASKPFLVDSKWYFVTGFDDDKHDGTGPHAGHTQGIQNGYFVRDMNGKIVSTLLDGEGGVAFHGAIGRSGFHQGAISKSHVASFAVVGSKAYGGLLDAGLILNSPGRVVVTVDFAADFYSSAPNVIAGGVPASASALDAVQELSPIHFPYNDFEVVESGGTTIATCYVVCRYVITDNRGKVRRSAPSAITLTPTIFTSGGSTLFTLRVPTLRHLIAESATIEIYGSPDTSGPGDIFLQATAPNDPTVDTIDVTVTPALWNDGGERLDTIGGGIEQASLPPARIAWTFGSRLFLGGTPDGQIWPSLELIPGRGYEFNETLAFLLPPGAGELIVGADIDGTAFAAFCEGGIFLGTGAGPDGRGIGGYAITRVQTDKTAASPRAVAKGPLGLYFLNRKDGRACVLSGGAVTDIGQGQEAIRRYIAAAAVAGDPPSSANDNAADGDRFIRFFYTNGKQSAFDYAHPLNDEPAGQWYVHEGAGLPTAVDARLIGGTPVLLPAGADDAAETWSPSPGINDDDFLDDGVEVLTDLEHGRMGLAGYMNEFDTDWVTLSSTHLGGASTFEYTLTGSDGTPEVHPDSASTADDVTFRSGVFRAREASLRIKETSATGRGRRFDGAAVDVRAYGRTKRPYRQIG